MYLQYYLKGHQANAAVLKSIDSNIIEIYGGLPPYSINKTHLEKLEKEILNTKNVLYYALWSPKTHLGRNPWEARFSRFYETFRMLHPQARPEKIICYPNGTPAVEIFKINSKNN